MESEEDEIKSKQASKRDRNIQQGRLILDSFFSLFTVADNSLLGQFIDSFGGKGMSHQAMPRGIFGSF